MSDGATSWFEIPARDHDRAVAFYQTVLGATLSPETKVPLPPGMRMSVFPNDRASGAIVSCEGYSPSADGVVVYLNAGGDLAPALARVAAAGGRVLIGKMAIGGDCGFFAHILDCEGNRIGLHSMA